eukprot:UN03689
MVLQSVHQAKEEQHTEGSGLLGSIFNSTNAWLITGVATLASAAYVGYKYWNGDGSISDIISSVAGISSSRSNDDDNDVSSSSYVESYSVDIKPVAATQPTATTTNTPRATPASVAPPKPVEPSGFKMSF